MKSRQYSAGIYSRLPYNIRLSIEGFYKTMNNLIEYNGDNQLNPSADDWEENVRTGKGKAYGAEADISYSNGKHLSMHPTPFHGAKDSSRTFISHGTRTSSTTVTNSLST